MPKFNVSYSEIVHYLTQEIEAKDEDEAREKFTELLNEDDLPINDSETYYLKVEEAKD